MKPRAAGRNPGTHVPHSASLHAGYSPNFPNVNCFTDRISPPCEEHDSSMTVTGGDHAAALDPQSLDHRRKARPSRTPDAVPELGTGSADRQASGTLDHRRDRGGGSPVAFGSL